jgi:hypothetical protein
MYHSGNILQRLRETSNYIKLHPRQYYTCYFSNVVKRLHRREQNYVDPAYISSIKMMKMIQIKQ